MTSHADGPFVLNKCVDDKISKIACTKKFVDYQGWDAKCDVIFQDNASAIKILNNGRDFSGKRTRHFDIIFLCKICNCK